MVIKIGVGGIFNPCTHGFWSNESVEVQIHGVDIVVLFCFVKPSYPGRKQM